MCNFGEILIIFNSLSAVYWLIFGCNDGAAQEVIGSLTLFVVVIIKTQFDEIDPSLVTLHFLKCV